MKKSLLGLLFILLINSVLAAMPAEKKNAKLSLKKIELTLLLKKQLKKTKWAEEVLQEDCSEILLKSGETIIVEITEITETVIKYKPCGKPNEPEISISKTDIVSIKSTNKKIIDTRPTPTPEGNYQRKADGFAVASLILGITSILSILVGFVILILGAVTFHIYGLGILGFAVISAILALIFGILGLTRISSEPEHRKGRGYAIAGIVCAAPLILSILLALLSFVR